MKPLASSGQGLAKLSMTEQKCPHKFDAFVESTSPVSAKLQCQDLLFWMWWKGLVLVETVTALEQSWIYAGIDRW